MNNNIWDDFDFQGWNEHTKLFLLEQFICQQGLQDKLYDYLKEIAEQENNTE